MKVKNNERVNKQFYFEQLCLGKVTYFCLLTHRQFFKKAGPDLKDC